MKKKTPKLNCDYDPNTYWDNTADSYPHYPTVRHRTRFIVDSLRKLAPFESDAFIFDYGCGEGGTLHEITRALGMEPGQVGGCDVSANAIRRARARVGSPHLYDEGFPSLDRECSVVICSEVIEHVKTYPDILRWIHAKLAGGGTLILTTQAGKIHASDTYTGHVQHFALPRLKSELAAIGFKITYARLWGFPLFTLQKYMTDINFEAVREHYLEGPPSIYRRALFAAAYRAYFLHDLVPLGPQIFIRARKERSP